LKNRDIAEILEGWEYEPDRVSARWITGRDGLPKVQLRLDLGLFQMEAEGRPDGTTPRGYPSLLEYYKSLEKTIPPGHPSLDLHEEACAELQQEAVQYYYRYLAFYALKYLEGVIRDTDHNLQILDLVARHAVDEEMAWQFLQFFPYVRMMHARAVAEKESENHDYEKAIEAVRSAIQDIRAFWENYGDDEELVNDGDEEEILQELLHRLQRHKPRSEADRLREDLEKAVAAENYEKAAALRDQLRKLVETAHESVGDGQ